MEVVVIVLFVVLLAPLLLELLVHVNLFIIRFRENWKEEIGCLIFFIFILIMALMIYFLMIRPAQQEREGAIHPEPPVFHAFNASAPDAAVCARSCG